MSFHWPELLWALLLVPLVLLLWVRGERRRAERAGTWPVGGAGDAKGIVHAGCSLARSMRGGGMAARTAVRRLSGVTCSARAW